MGNSIRVRFAPSPTGPLHIGGVRTALFNWLFAKHNGGTYLLRIEDTDHQRSTKEAERSQLQSLEWLGLLPEEEPVRQSGRADRHKEVLENLCQSGHVYEKDGALWFRVPRDVERISFPDMIRGTIEIPTDIVDDFVVRRSDGSPIYNFCVVVDDHDMEITHVIRGEDHISNTFKQLFLYSALEWDAPQFAHLPLIVNESGAPLSKRDCATDVTHYKNDGFLPEAFLNYLVRLGWAHGDQEIFTLQQMVECFTLRGVGKKAAVFDRAKMLWLNQQHMKNMAPEQILAYGREMDLVDNAISLSDEQMLTCITLYREREKTVAQLFSAITNFSQTPDFQETDDALVVSKKAHNIVDTFYNIAKEYDEWSKPRILDLAKQIAKEAGGGLKVVGMPLRYAITGSLSSPGVFDLMMLLGKKESLVRISRYLAKVDFR